MDLTGDRLTVTITDDGVPFNPLNAKPPDIDAPLEERQIGGLGIHLARSLIDDATYQRRIGKNAITLMKHLEQEKPRILADQPKRQVRISLSGEINIVMFRCVDPCRKEARDRRPHMRLNDVT